MTSPIPSLLRLVLVCAIIWLVLHVGALLVVGLHDTAQLGADIIVILGNKVEEDGTVSKRLQRRLDQGVSLFEQKKAPLIVVSGGIGKEGYSEADVMKEYLIQKGIPEDRIILDRQGINTYQTAKNVTSFALEQDINSVIVVSQYYHILRTKAVFKRFGYGEVYGSYARMRPELRDIYSIPREVIAYYAYLFKDYSR